MNWGGGSTPSQPPAIPTLQKSLTKNHISSVECVHRRAAPLLWWPKQPITTFCTATTQLLLVFESCFRTQYSRMVCVFYWTASPALQTVLDASYTVRCPKVAWSACVSHDRERCKNGWTGRRDVAIRCVDSRETNEPLIRQGTTHWRQLANTTEWSSKYNEMILSTCRLLILATLISLIESKRVLVQVLF